MNQRDHGDEVDVFGNPKTEDEMTDWLHQNSSLAPETPNERTWRLSKTPVLGQPPGYGNLDRAIHNSPPPLDDVGGCDPLDFDEFDPDRLDPTKELLKTRGHTHGKFSDNAYIAQHLRGFWREQEGWGPLTVEQHEALDYMAGKISRILSGDGSFPDHWQDIAGYAMLAITD
jgi:hypothetical protein